MAEKKKGKKPRRTALGVQALDDAAGSSRTRQRRHDKGTTGREKSGISAVTAHSQKNRGDVLRGWQAQSVERYLDLVTPFYAREEVVMHRKIKKTGRRNKVRPFGQLFFLKT